MNSTQPVTDVEQFEEDLRQRLWGRVADLGLVVHDGGLILRGRAVSYHSKQVAQHAAMELTGMPILANRIEVSRPPAYAGWNAPGGYEVGPP